MQLTIEVLPAPLGPMMENSSPSFTAKETSVSARTPPKRSDTPRTSNVFDTHSLRIWRLRGALYLRFAVATMTLHRWSTSGHPTKEAGQDLPSSPALMRGNAAPRDRAMCSIFARWPSIGQCDSLKCLLPDNWSGNFRRGFALLQRNKLTAGGTHGMRDGRCDHDWCRISQAHRGVVARTQRAGDRGRPRRHRGEILPRQRACFHARRCV